MDLGELEGRLNYKFQEKSLLETALTHRSYLSEPQGEGKPSNERLEFLGDSVLAVIVNEYIYGIYPDASEGTLSKMKSVLVSEAVLSRIASQLQLGDFLFMSKGEEQSGGRERASLLADAFEALIGAMYLDSGLTKTRDFLLRELGDEVVAVERGEEGKDYKSILQEVLQAQFKVGPTYKVIDERGPDHDKVFTIEVKCGQKVLGRGTGKSKKEAEQAAAAQALKKR